MGKWTHEMQHALERLGHEITAWFEDDFPGVRGHGRWAVVTYPVALALRLRREASRFDVAVIHEPSALWATLLRRLGSSIPPIVVMCHNVESHVYRAMRDAASVGFARLPLASRLRTRAIRLPQSNWSIRLADQVVSLSRSDHDYITQVLHVPPDRVASFPNGVERTESGRRPAPSSHPRVLFVGGWLDVKGRRILPLTWHQVLERLPHARLTVVGAGVPEVEVLESFASRIRNTVSVIPRITDPRELQSLMETSDALFVPSLTEGSPLTLLEAMAVGLPVVASRVGGIPDIVSDEENGLLFEPLDPGAAARAILRLLDEPPLWSRLSDTGRRRAAELTWNTAAVRLERLVRSLLEDKAHLDSK